MTPKTVEVLSSVISLVHPVWSLFGQHEVRSWRNERAWRHGAFLTRSDESHLISSGGDATGPKQTPFYPPAYLIFTSL